MSAEITVKVDNWANHVLGRFKYLYNHNDYCDLTLQFKNNQLKVHRLILSSCTEYFQVLEKTCEIYEDCLVMPDDLQADVVVPIINFIYTGQMVFQRELLEKLHACSQIMNMPMLTKLLDCHRPEGKTLQTYSQKARLQNIQTQRTQVHQSKFPPTASLEVVEPPVLTSTKRSYANAFETTTVKMQDKKHQYASNKTSVMNVTTSGLMYRASSPVPSKVFGQFKPLKSVSSEPRPTRYELPEELDSDNLFENSFTNISYTSQPLMIHPERPKLHTKRPKQDYGLPSTSKKSRTNILDIVERKKVTKESENSSFGETSSCMIFDELEMFRKIEQENVETESNKDPDQLINQLLDEEEHSTKVTIEAPKNNKSANLEHATIISKVLKKYPNLVQNNKNLKLKIFNNPTPSKVAVTKQKACYQQVQPVIRNTNEGAISDLTYETDVIDSQQAARLIVLGAENTEGPWICLICGTPGRALHFTSYYIFRRHLVEVHNEKPVQNICEHCGQRMSKRNHLLHHLYSKHGVEPPSSHNFPKCQLCNYIALNQALLVKHKLTHVENKSFRCNVCASMFNSSKMLLHHIQSTGHKCIADRKPNHLCLYCFKPFIRENNLYAHLKTRHKVDAVNDRIIDASDDESNAIEISDNESKAIKIKYKPVVNEVVDNLEYHIQQRSNGNIQLIPKKSLTKQTILNIGLNPAPKDLAANKSKATKEIHYILTNIENMSFDHGNEEEIFMIDNNEYVSLSGHKLILRNAARQLPNEFILSGMDPEKSVSNSQTIIPSTSVNCSAMMSTDENVRKASIRIKNTGNLAEAIPIYVSNEDNKASMAANHNNIYDAADENKTLTVSTTLEAATLNSTGIDIDNAQNNDMMTIQENYPLNASEDAVVTDNSNKVVVYSQYVNDPNKGYPQYASEILTHNYKTVSTASTVSRAQVPDPLVTTWQGENPHYITNSGAAQESNNDINELPEVQLDTVISQPAVISQIEETHNDTPSENLQPESEIIQSSQIIQMPVDEPVVATEENVIDNIESNYENFDHQTERINETDTQAIDQKSESENMPEIETEIIRMVDPNSDIQPEGVQKSNDNINNLPKVHLDSVISQPAVISQIEETQNDTPSENVQPESEIIQSSKIIRMQVDEPAVATKENVIDNVESNYENIDHQTEHINEVETQGIDQKSESVKIPEVNNKIIRMDYPNSDIQPEGVEESNNDINNLPEVQLETVNSQTSVISQIEETHNDTPSENLQPESEMIQSSKIIQVQVDEPVVARKENVIDNVESNYENIDHQTEHINKMEMQAIDQISESQNMSEVKTEIIKMDDSNSEIQSEGVHVTMSQESNNVINDLPEVKWENITIKLEEVHDDTPEILQPKSEIIQSSQIIQIQVDEPVVATKEKVTDNIESNNYENSDHQTEHINESERQAIDQISESQNISEVKTEIIRMDDSNSEIQSEGVYVTKSQESNNDINDLPEVKWETITIELEEVHDDTPEILQPESEIIQSSPIIQMQVDEPVVATEENVIDNVEPNYKNIDNQTEYINETKTQGIDQKSESEKIPEVNNKIIRMDYPNSNIQSEGVEKSNNDIKNLPEVQLETVNSQTSVISQIEETHNDTPSENLQPESEMIQSSKIIQVQVDEPVVARKENVIDNVESNYENIDHQTERINKTDTQATDQISESSDEDKTAIIRTDDPNSDSNNSHCSGSDENDQNEEDETLASETEEDFSYIPPMKSESGARDTLNPVNISSLLNDWDDSQEDNRIDKSEATVINTERTETVNKERYYGACRSP